MDEAALALAAALVAVAVVVVVVVMVVVEVVAAATTTLYVGPLLFKLLVVDGKGNANGNANGNGNGTGAVVGGGPPLPVDFPLALSNISIAFLRLNRPSLSSLSSCPVIQNRVQHDGQVTLESQFASQHSIDRLHLAIFNCRSTNKKKTKTTGQFQEFNQS